MKTAAGWWFAGLCAVALAGFALITGRQLQGGVNYPEYCSLRSDPGGTRLLADALARLPGYSVERNFLPIAGLPSRPARLILFAGVSDDGFRKWNAADVDALDEAVRSGSRLVLAFRGDVQGNWTPPPGRSAAEDRWGISPPHLTEAGMPTGFVFHAPEKWPLVRDAKGGRPEIHERNLGFGQIVVAEGAQFLTNEALASQRDTGLLVWLMGGRKRVTIDDSHLGVDIKGGVVALARHYGLTMGLLLLLAAFALLAWHRSAPFVFVAPDAPEPRAAYRPTASLAALLRRSLKPDDLIRTCRDEAAADPRSTARNVGAPPPAAKLHEWYNSHLSPPRP